MADCSQYLAKLLLLASVAFPSPLWGLDSGFQFPEIVTRTRRANFLGTEIR